MATIPRFSDTLRAVAPIIAEHKFGQLILRELAAHERCADCPTSGEFDVAAALYWIGSNYHDGMFSVWYRVLSVIGFKPGACANGPEPESSEQYLYETIASILDN